MSKRIFLEERFGQGCLAPALLLAGLFALLCAFSCAKMEEQVEGCVIPVRFVLEEGAGYLSGKTYSAALAKSIDESLLKDVNIYVVSEAGAVLSHEYITASREAIVTIYDNLKYKVYAVANLGKSVALATEGEILSLKGDEGSSAVSGSGGSGVLMSGKLPLQVLRGKQGITVPLTRAVAKIEVKGDMTGLNDDVSVKVKQVRLRNVPKTGTYFCTDKVKDVSEVKDGDPMQFADCAGFPGGVEFYMLENMQGTLLPGNTSQKDKVWPQGSLYAGVCSYVEIVAQYESDLKEGDVVYRFYLGSDACSNYDVQRNVKYVVSVFFKGNGGVDENSWRVDVEDLDDVIPPKVEFASENAVMYDLEETTVPFAAAEGKWELEVESSDPSELNVTLY